MTTQNVTRSSPSSGSIEQVGGSMSHSSSAPVGDTVGKGVGNKLGFPVGELVGNPVGTAVGGAEGVSVGHSPQKPSSSATWTNSICSHRRVSYS